METFLDQIDAVWGYKYSLLWSGSGAAWAFTVLALSRCSFMYHNAEEMGLFSKTFLDQRGQRLGCVRYGSRFLADAHVRTGQAFAVLACLCATIALVGIGTSLCWRFRQDRKKALWRGGRFGLGGAFVSQLLSFTIVGSEALCPGRCRLAGVGALSLFNTVVILVLLVTSHCLPPPRHSWLTMVTREAGAETNDKGNEHTTTTGDQNNDSPTPAVWTSEMQSSPRFRSAFQALLSLACSLSFCGLRRCSFMHVSMTTTAGVGYGAMSKGLGLYSQAVDDQVDFLGCVVYPKGMQPDSALRAARAFGVFAMALAFLSVSIGIAQLFCKTHQRLMWTMLRVTLPAAACSHLLTFTIFSSSSCNANDSAHCSLGESGTIVLLDVLLLVSLSAVVISTPPPTGALLFVIKSQDIGQIATETQDQSLTGESYEDEDGEKSQTESVRSTTTSTVDHVSITIDYLGCNKRVTKVVSGIDGSKVVTMKMTQEEMSDEDDCSTVFTATTSS